MFKKYYLLLLILFVSCLSGSFLFAQETFTVRGIVKDSLTEMPLTSVTVKIDGEYQVALSNKNGVFQLPTRQQHPVAHFSYVGYEEKTMTLNLTENRNEAFIIFLSPKSVELEEVVTKYVRPKYSKKNNPAVELIEKVIARKNNLRPESLPYYQYEKYERTSLALNNFGEKKFRALNFLEEYKDSSKINETPIL
ncbi:MAG: carboxypeptidase-like regulatory domain-containing protein [Candidatus Azobacteroides sp.]|nr:carboxypeptidase-like regulatory domain-containing protein [Candidatus Azobacteroides sp.]